MGEAGMASLQLATVSKLLERKEIFCSASCVEVWGGELE